MSDKALIQPPSTLDPNGSKDAKPVNETFLADVSRTEQPAFAAKHALPQTSSQVNSWTI